MKKSSLTSAKRDMRTFVKNKNYFIKSYAVILLFVAVYSFSITGQCQSSRNNDQYSTVAINELYDFMIDFQKQINTDQKDIRDFFYSNSEINVYNFLKKDGTYDNINVFFNYLDTLKKIQLNDNAINNSVSFYNLNLRNFKKLNFISVYQFEVITEVLVTKTIVKTYGSRTNTYDTTLSSNEKKLNFLVIRSNYQNPEGNTGRVKIIDIESADESYLSQNYTKLFIPDNVQLNFNTSNTDININDNNINAKSNSDLGYAANLLVEYPIKRWGQNILSVSAGAGISKFKSTHQIGEIDMNFPSEDVEGQEYTRFVEYDDISQDISLLYANVPFLLNFSYNISKKHALKLSAGLNFSYLINNSMTQNQNGTIHYYGKYVIDGYNVVFNYLPDFGYDQFRPTLNKSESNFNDIVFFGMANLGYVYRINKRFSVVAAVSYTQTLTNPITEKYDSRNVSPGYGKINPIINYCDNVGISSIGLNLGISMNLKDLTKPLLFGKLKRDTRPSQHFIENAYVNEYDLPVSSYILTKKKDDKVAVNIDKSEFCDNDKRFSRTPKIPFASLNRNKVLVGKIKKSNQKIKVLLSDEELSQSKNGLYLKKPFSYQISGVDQLSSNIGRKVYFLDENALMSKDDIILQMAELPDFNLNIVSLSIGNLRSKSFSSNRNSYIEKLEEMTNEGFEENEECYTFFFDAENFNDIKNYEPSDEYQCFSCQDTVLRKSLSQYVYQKSNSVDPDASWDNKIKEILANHLLPERRTVTFNLFVADMKDLEKIVPKLVKLNENVKVNYYLHSEDISKNPGTVNNVISESIEKFVKTNKRSLFLKNSDIIFVDK